MEVKRSLLSRLFRTVPEDKIKDFKEIEELLDKDEEKPEEKEDKDTKKEDKVTEKVAEQEVKKVAAPKYDSKTGLFDLKDIDDEDLKAVLKLANDNVKTKANTAAIDKALSDKVNTLKLAKGITTDFILKNIDRSGIKVGDDGVTGVDEAIDGLKKSQAGLFEVENKGNGGFNPNMVGFNPQVNQDSNNKVPNSFAEAFSMMNNANI
jgi:hypothetical protein